MSEFSTLLPGDPLPTSVRVWNPILEAARAHREKLTPGLSSEERETDKSPTNVILLHNTTSVNRVRGSTMKVLRAYGPTSETIDARFSRDRVYPGVQHDARSTSIVRLLDAIPAGKVGRAQIVAPYADVDPGTVGHTRRYFGGHRMLSQPFLRCGEFDWVRWGSSGLMAPWNLNSSGFGFTGIISNSFNVANNSQYFYRLPFLKFSTIPSSAAGVYQGVQAHHLVHAFATTSSNFLIKIPRRTIESGGNTIGWSYDGVDCQMGNSIPVTIFRSSGHTIPPLFVPRMPTSVSGSNLVYSSYEPPATIEHSVFMADPLMVFELSPNALYARAWQFNRIAAYGSPDSQPIEIRCTSCQTSFIVYDVDDTIDAGGVINPPTSPGTAGVLGSAAASGSATLQLSTGSVGGGGGVAVLPPSEITHARVAAAAAGEVATATGPNATHTLSLGGV